MSALLFLTVALPSTGGAVLLVLGRLLPPRSHLAVGATAVLALGAASGCAVIAARHDTVVTWGFVLGDAVLSATGTGGVFLPGVLAVGTVVLLAATATPETREPRFVGLMLIFAAAAALTVLAGTLPVLLLGWELMGATSYALVGYRLAEPRRVGSGATAFLTTRAADLGLYLAVAAAVAGGGADGATLSIDRLATLEGGWRDLAAAGVLVAALGKAAQLPFSFWLSRAMDGPSPASALLHSAAMVALGGYLLLVAAPLLAATSWAAQLAAWLGVSTAVALGAVAIVQTDLKQLLAASTAAQLGFVVLAAGVGATAAGTAHLVAHAAVKALLFLAAGAWLEALGSKRLDTLVGAARRWPAVGALATVALLSLAGLPPLALWATKDAVLAGALAVSPALYGAGLVATALAAAYALTALVVLLTRPDDDPPGVGSEEVASWRVPRTLVVALVPLGLGAAALGLLATFPVLDALPGAVPAEPHPWELLASGVVVAVSAVAVVAARRTRRTPRGRAVGRAHALLTDWWGLERVAHAIVVGPTLTLAERAAQVDRRILTRAVHGAGAGVLLGSHGAARADTALARSVDLVGAAATRAGRGLRRGSATGQLHHYYLQLVVGVLVVLVAAVVVLVVQG